VLRQDGHARLPALVIHGTRDAMLPVERGRETRDRLLALGVPTAYREFEMQHEIRPDALRTVVEWLGERVLRPIRTV
jgi:phospholipase/carboxylesterase